MAYWRGSLDPSVLSLALRVKSPWGRISTKPTPNPPSPSKSADQTSHSLPPLPRMCMELHQAPNPNPCPFLNHIIIMPLGG